MIYFAPIQGFTDFVYRKAFSEIFSGVDVFFIPYIFFKNETIPQKYFAEIIPGNNPSEKVVPQVLAGNETEMVSLAKMVRGYGYPEINLNLGCPYPMVANRGRGAGLLPSPQKVKSLLLALFEHTDIKLSVKVRAGLFSFGEIDQIIPVLNEFPLTEVIFHPRVAKQLYSGEINKEVFQQVSQTCRHPLVYNGDIFSVAGFRKIQELFPGTTTWMLGRGILMDPFLPAKIHGISFSDEEKRMKLEIFHRRIFELYYGKMDNQGNVLNKMKQFWAYFSYSFTEQHKVLKAIKKTNDLADFNGKVKGIFQNAEIGI